MSEVRETVLEVLAQLGSSREARQYLKEFSSVEESRFAVVKVGGGILRDHLDELAAALAFLHRLGLRPVVLHGAGPQMDEALNEAGVESERVDGLRVTSRTSSFAFKDTRDDVRHIGKDLNVGAVVEGSVRKAGNQLRITAQLINTVDGYHIWSEV